MSKPPTLPEGVCPNARHVEFYAMQCRTCGAVGPWVTLGDTLDPGHQWDGHHAKAYQGHRRFWQWSVVRSAATVGF